MPAALALSFHTVDDAFIHLRYAANLLEGHGLVFNPGERVEGYSNLLWTLLCAGAGWLGLPMLAFAKVLGVACFAGSTLVLHRVARRCFPGAPPAAWLVPPVYLALDAMSAHWAGSGMETPLAALLLLLAADGVLASALGDRRGHPGLYLGLLALVRPEGPMYLVALAPFVLAARRKGDLARLLVEFGAVFGALLAFRLLYYGEWLPNTFHAKATAPAWLRLEYGAFYLETYARAMWVGLLLMAACAVAMVRLAAGAADRARRWVTRLALVATAAQIAFVLGVGGDWMEGFRFLVVVTPLWALGVGAVFATRRRWAAAAGLGTVLVVDLFALLGLLDRWGGRWDRLFRPSLEGPWEPVVAALAEEIPPGSLVAATDIGLLGYRLRDRRILDIMGLTDPHIARYAGNVGMLHAQSGNPVYVLAREPGSIVVWHWLSEAGPLPALEPVRELEVTRAFRERYSLAWTITSVRTYRGMRREWELWKRRDEPRAREATRSALDLADEGDREQVLGGVYPPEAGGLCWVQGRAAFVLRSPAGEARAVELEGAFGPRLPGERGSALLTLTVWVAGERAGSRSFARVHAGAIRVPLPAGLRELPDRVEVEVVADRAVRTHRDPRLRAYALKRIALVE